MPVQTQILTRRGTAASWTSTNPTLGAGEIGYETDTGRFKIGTGAAAWASLGYFNRDPLTTKGDLYTFSTTDDRLAVGANGESLVADSSTSTGLRWNTTPTIGNPIINGGLDIWQRGTSFTSPVTGTFTADRWNSINTSAATTTITRQTTSDTTNLPFIQYCIRYQRTSGQTATGSLYLTYGMENSMSTPFIGKTVTLSFYARKGANYSPTSSLLQVRGVSGTGTDQNINSGFTGNVDFISSTATLTTTWQRFTYTATVSASATQLGFYVFAQTGGTAGAADYYEITGAQYDVGSVALPFARAGGTIQGELAACQRYYFRTTPTAGTQYGLGYIDTTTTAILSYWLPVAMRIAPTALETSGTASDYSVRTIGGGVTTATVVPAFGNSTLTNAAITFTSTGLTAGQPTNGRAANTSAYLGWSAEL